MLFTPSRSKEKICPTYLELSRTYFKIQGTYFPPASKLERINGEAYLLNADKTVPCGGGGGFYSFQPEMLSWIFHRRE